ncbi:MAG: hypothetical protein CVV33_06205 [Methanomicrobiales archaeon HGW-Methanomicrobiales-4]|nr:MAG: hypothetical protein CVV33_06205 [Methanomicrobiales archaeon HGW-Methanomicrobiales-4]
MSCLIYRGSSSTSVHFFRPIIRFTLLFTFLILVLPVGAASSGPVVFPPVSGPYTGDYVYITEPGRYSLEHSLSHQYPVGVIIAAPSVILDGQGYSIQPAVEGASSSVGIWVSLTDRSGRPVTGVTIRNVNITGEGYGIYAEGTDTSEFEWGVDRDGDPAITSAAASLRSLILSGIRVSSCREGIVLHNQSGATITDIRASENSGSGIIINEGQARINESNFTGNNRYGIQITGGSGTEISGSTIKGNGEAGIRVDQAEGVRIFNNALDNTLNLQAGSDSRGIVLATARHEGINIVGGSILGGNYWADDGNSLPGKEGVTDKNGDGIGDSPYNVGTGISDPSPLFILGEIRPTTQMADSELTLNPTPEVTSPSPVQTPLSILSGIHAVIISDTIPSEMDTGKDYHVALHIFNDGSDDWIPQHLVGIMALEDAALYGAEWMVAPILGSVQSGQTVNIDFTIHAPPKPGIYSLKYQAAREGSGIEVLFGRAYTKTVTVR